MSSITLDIQPTITLEGVSFQLLLEATLSYSLTGDPASGDPGPILLNWNTSPMALLNATVSRGNIEISQGASRGLAFLLEEHYPNLLNKALGSAILEAFDNAAANGDLI